MKNQTEINHVTVQDLLDFIADISDGSFLNADEIVSQTGLHEERAEQMANLACRVLSGDIKAEDVKVIN